MKTIALLALLLTACGQDSSSKSTTEPTAETPPTDTATETKTDTGVGEPPAKTRTLLDANDAEVGVITDDLVDVASHKLAFSLEAGFIAPEKPITCFFKTTDCTNTCFALETDGIAFVDGNTIMTLSAKAKPMTIETSAGGGVQRPWKAKTQDKGCELVEPSLLETTETYYEAERHNFELPFHEKNE